MSGSGPVPAPVPVLGGKRNATLLPPVKYQKVKAKSFTFDEFIKWCKEEVSPVKVWIKG